MADARMVDAGAAATFSGTVAVHDVSILGQSAAVHGGQIDVSFHQRGAPVEMHFDDGVALVTCSADLVDVTKAAQANPVVDEGSVQIAITGTGVPTIPPCALAGSSYRCISAMGTGGMIAQSGPPFIFTDTTASPTTFTSLQAGEYLLVSGNPGAGTALPIVAAPGGSTLALYPLSGTPPATVGAWITAAGVGPVPGGPAFLPAGATVKVTINAGSKAGADFTMAATGDIAAGSAFTLDTATQALMAGPVDLGAAHTFGCDGAGGTCGDAAGIIIVIDSSDNATAGTDMTPTKFSGNITCPAFDTHRAVPAAAFAVLAAGNPHKLRITVFRDGFQPLTQAKGSVNVVAGHGVVSFAAPQ